MAIGESDSASAQAQHEARDLGARTCSEPCKASPLVIARLVTYEGPVSSDLEGVRMYDESALPWLQDAHGFRGLLVLVDRENERTVALSSWTDEDAERESEEARRRFGELVAERIGLTRDEGQVYEVVLGRGVHLDGPLA